MNCIRELLISYVHPEVSDRYYKNARWSKPNIHFPRRCAHSKKWLWNKDKPLRGVFEHLEPSGPSGMVFLTETRWLSEASYIMLKLSGKILD